MRVCRLPVVCVVPSERALSSMPTTRPSLTTPRTHTLVLLFSYDWTSFKAGAVDAKVFAMPAECANVTALNISGERHPAASAAGALLPGAHDEHKGKWEYLSCCCVVLLLLAPQCSSNEARPRPPHSLNTH